MKTPDDYFHDWEASAFGYGYGNGEEAIMPVLKAFVSALSADGNYDYKLLEAAAGAAPAWFLINVL